LGVAEYMNTNSILLGVGSANRDEIFKTLASTFVISGLIGEKEVDELVAKLIERENLSTTGIGKGLAIPHASINSIDETVIALGVVPGGVDFGSVDGKPANLIFMIIGSQSVPRHHIQILAKIVRLCKNKELIDKVRNGTDTKEVLETIRMMDT